MRYMTLKSFRFLNPDWQIILYVSKCSKDKKPWMDEVEQDFFAFRGKDYLYKVHELGVEIHEWSMPEFPDIGASHLSNFLKWYKLQAHGGVYADMDILWMRSMDELYNEMQKYDTAICSTKYLSIGLLGSCIGNRMFQSFFDHARKHYEPHRYQCVGVENIYALLYNDDAFLASGDVNWDYLATRNILQDLRDMFPDLKIFNIPFGQIYPFGCTEVNKIFEATYRLPPHVVAIHWYAGHPIAQHYNGFMHEDNVKDIRNTFSEVANRYV